MIDAIPVYEKVRYAMPDGGVPGRDRSPSFSTALPELPRLSVRLSVARVGNAVGHKKRNKQVGAVVGAVLGCDHRERHPPGIRPTVCARPIRHAAGLRYVHRVSRTKISLVGYDVTYEYAGRTYSTRMRRHPGDEIRIRVTPIER